MLLRARDLVRRLRGERAAELRELSRRWAALPSATQADAEDVALAEELARLRERLAEALGSVESCSDCARGHPLPFGRWAGGHCCGGRTDALFTDDELAALKLGGTRLASLRPPRSELAGCVFRASDGCSLMPRDRPSLCVRYTCRELEGELTERGDRARISELQAEIARVFTAFVARRRRAEAERELAELTRLTDRPAG